MYLRQLIAELVALLPEFARQHEGVRGRIEIIWNGSHYTVIREITEKFKNLENCLDNRK